MSVKEKNSDYLIKETAKRLFFVEGKVNATTQEIADAAGVNRTLVHYYFRSRDLLFQTVYKEALLDLRERIREVFLDKSITFRDKVGRFIDKFSAHITQYPYLEVFFLTEINKISGEKVLVYPKGEFPEGLGEFIKEIKLEMEKGTIVKMHPYNFIANLFSLIAYPIVTKSIYIDSWGVEESEFERVLAERKEIILNLLLRPN